VSRPRPRPAKNMKQIHIAQKENKYPDSRTEFFYAASAAFGPETHLLAKFIKLHSLLLTCAKRTIVLRRIRANKLLIGLENSRDRYFENKTKVKVKRKV